MTKTKELKPLNMTKLRKDMQLIMDEIDRTGGVLPDAYSPVMWQRLQDATDRVATAVQAVRLVLSGMNRDDVATKLGMGRQRVAAYMAWNTMLQPDWVSPRMIIAETPCPICGAQKGERCRYSSAPPHKIHKERREVNKLARAAQAVA